LRDIVVLILSGKQSALNGTFWSSRDSWSRQVLARNMTFAFSSNQAAGQLTVMTEHKVPIAVIHRQLKLAFNFQSEMK
jgi:hypothetical protein